MPLQKQKIKTKQKKKKTNKQKTIVQTTKPSCDDEM